MEDISGTSIGGPRDDTGTQLALQGILAHWMSIVFLEISTSSNQSPVIWITTKTALCFIKKRHIEKAKCKKIKNKVLLNEHE